MKLLAFVAGLAAACGDGAKPEAIHAAMDPLPAPTPVAQPKAVMSLAKDLDRLASQLAATDLSKARDRIVAIHALPSWTRARASHRDYKPLEPSRLDAASAAFDKAQAPVYQAARALRDGRIADGVAMFDATVTALFDKPLRDLRSDLVDELAFDRDEVCTQITCDGLPMLASAFETVRALEMLLAATRAQGARSLATELGPTLDDHTRVVLSRAMGEGPGYGATCGAEDLCESGQVCMAATHTCERRCFAGAESPCPAANRTCRSIPGLSGTYCRAR